jgi:hypothetical protein
MYIALQPLVALIAGILILMIPRLLNYIVALYLIVTGILGIARMYNLNSQGKPVVTSTGKEDSQC